MEEKKSNNILNIPTAIIIAGAIISVIYTMKPTGSSNGLNSQSAKQVEMKPITEKDYILGNPNAKIKIVEYSDT